MIEATRRGFLVGLGTGIALLSAPAIVRASSIMPVVKVPKRRIISHHSVSVLRSELVLEVQVDGEAVDWCPIVGNAHEIAVRAANGADIFVAIPPMGARDTNIMAGVRWQ